MADDELKEEPILARLRGKPGEPPAGLTSFVGLLGRSPKPGYWLLYLNLDMSRSVEIAESDIVRAEKLSPEQSPFGGLGGTRVFVKRDAKVTQAATQTQQASAAAPDEFDLDVRPDRIGTGKETGAGMGIRWRFTLHCATNRPWECGTPNPGGTYGQCTA